MSTKSELASASYKQDAGNDQWNDATPTLQWTAHKQDEAEVFLPFLTDVVLTLGDRMFYTHITVLASGARGSVFLGNVVASQRENQADDSILSLDISSLLPAPTATKALSCVLDYMYTSKVEFPVDALASVVVSAYVLRIRSLFAIARDQLVEVLDSGSVSSAIQVLSDAQRIPATEDTEELLGSIVKQAKKKVNAAGSSSNVSSLSKARRRRASYKAAMSTVHNKTLGVRARVKESAPGKLKEDASSQDETTEKGMSSNQKNAAERPEIQEHVVSSDHSPGERISSTHKGRRFSFTVPHGAQAGDVLKVVVPKATFAKASAAPPPPPSPPPSEEREEEDPTESLLWVYIDADDAEFGPFARDMMRGWLAGGMIPRELRVRPASRDDLDFKPLDELFGESSQPFFYMSSETMDK